MVFFFQLYIFKYNLPRQFKTKQTKKRKQKQVMVRFGPVVDHVQISMLWHPLVLTTFLSHTLPYVIV